jgi:hypothetical protein
MGCGGACGVRVSVEQHDCDDCKARRRRRQGPGYLGQLGCAVRPLQGSLDDDSKRAGSMTAEELALARDQLRQQAADRTAERAAQDRREQRAADQAREERITTGVTGAINTTAHTVSEQLERDAANRRTQIEAERDIALQRLRNESERDRIRAGGTVSGVEGLTLTDGSGGSGSSSSDGGGAGLLILGALALLAMRGGL